MIEKNVKITVITPTYNRADFLPGSTDNTREVVEPYLKDKRVKYLYHENSGEPETVNWGWSLAKGEYFTQINSDDIVEATLFEKMVKAMDKNKDKVVAYPDFYLIDEKDNIIGEANYPDWDFISALSKFGCYPASVGTFIRKSSFENWDKLRTSKYKHINDNEMYWDMALEGDFLHIPLKLGSWRIHNNQISASRVDSIPEREQWHEYYFSKTDLPEEVKKIENDVMRSILEDDFVEIRKSNLSSEDKYNLLSEQISKYVYLVKLIIDKNKQFDKNNKKNHIMLLGAYINEKYIIIIFFGIKITIKRKTV
ncbi:glycosyltransferase [uncultured Brachyspira sp.]|uniref:glycosyltransferase family 2 protein n=1 Tax=uncultured Brachyspira sp. TaxID=221953 RepID=UPI0026158F54|nr:glycosyltransferase [uncultured Brachyspira sp.]